MFNSRRFRATVSVVALLGLSVQPVWAQQRRTGNPVLNACESQRAPLVKLDKAGVVALARKVGAPLELTWSCYAGGKEPCGRCDSCKLRAKGFAALETEDPALR